MAVETVPLWWLIVAPLIAGAVTGAAWWIAAVLTNKIRRKDYKSYEDWSASDLKDRFPLPETIAEVYQSAAEQRRKTLSQLVARVHQVANKAQTTYHDAIVGSAGCLVLAFLALATNTLFLALAQNSLRLESRALDYLLNWIDVVAIVAVLFLFIYGQNANSRWIRHRAAVELLRQYQYFKVIFPHAITPEPIDNLEAQFDIEADQIASHVQSRKISEINTRINRFWLQRKASLASHAFMDDDLSPEALAIYLAKRVRRQLGWFIDSRERLKHIADRRKDWLFRLYIFMVALALGQLMSFFPALFRENWNWHHVALPFLLLVTGGSAAMTAYYINQNSRTLTHRYNTQQRFINRWLEDFDYPWSSKVLPLQKFNDAEKRRMRDEILRFEDLMIEELIDWAHITSYDSIELAP